MITHKCTMTSLTNHISQTTRPFHLLRQTKRENLLASKIEMSAHSFCLHINLMSNPHHRPRQSLANTEQNTRHSDSITAFPIMNSVGKSAHRIDEDFCSFRRPMSSPRINTFICLSHHTHTNTLSQLIEWQNGAFRVHYILDVQPEIAKANQTRSAIRQHDICVRRASAHKHHTAS